MDQNSPITVAAADDHPLVRAGIAAVIGAEPDMRFVAEAADGSEAVQLYRQLRPDVLLMDLRMPVMDGLAAIRAIVGEFPEARIVALTTYDGDEDVHRALEAGASGYLLKDMLRTEVLNTIRTVFRGKRSIPAPVAAKLAEHMPRVELTEREREVLQLVARGLSNKQIAEAIGRTEGTVKVHLKNIHEKLGVDDRTGAVTTGLRRGIIRLD
ncbi:MAG TPA: response regulator transcription factor [Gemmatimonadales bacterium]|jgi:DNA-binding NarL/FixJ family response regulator